MHDELAEGCEDMFVSGGEIGHELFSVDSVEVVFECFELLPEGIYICCSSHGAITSVLASVCRLE